MSIWWFIHPINLQALVADQPDEDVNENGNDQFSSLDADQSIIAEEDGKSTADNFVSGQEYGMIKVLHSTYDHKAY